MKMETDVLCDGMIQGETVEIEETIAKKSRLLRRQTLVQKAKKFCAKEERNASIKKVSLILLKAKNDRSIDENLVLQECADVVDEVQERWRKRDEAKRRLEEYEDSEEVLFQKCQILAQAIAQSRHLVVYTGAGISTAAKIPDYRGPDGIWTRLKEGRDIGDHDLSLAEPTFTHMALFELYRRNILKYVVSQNCDGLHLRSGLPRTVLSEVHGNMYIEVCRNCKPHKEYWRLFDVTENTARFSHKTYRRCYTCNEPLVDSIVHFGERGSLQWPLNWKGACKNARDATTLLCLGSSLKVLKRYPWLWQMEKPVKKRPNLYIVNLQWTPKDECANVKLNGKCDVILKKVMEVLGIAVPKYDKNRDPIFAHATELSRLELHTTTQSFLNFCKNKKREVKSEKNSDCDDKKDCISPLDLSLNNTFQNNCDSNTDNSDFGPPKNSITYASDDDSNIDCTSEIKNNTLDAFSTTRNLNSSAKKPFFQNLDSQSAAALSFLSYNFLHQQMLNRYSEFFLYPYQTSFLYSGLHSIINPLPVIAEEISTPKIEYSTAKIEPMCTFCDQNYNSLTCMFYPKYEPVFGNQKVRYSKLEKRQKPNICLCCDYTTDEDDYYSSCLPNVSDKDSNNVACSNASADISPETHAHNYSCSSSSVSCSSANNCDKSARNNGDRSLNVQTCYCNYKSDLLSCVNCSSLSVSTRGHCSCSNSPVCVNCSSSDVSAYANSLNTSDNVNCSSLDVPSCVNVSSSDNSTCVNSSSSNLSTRYNNNTLNVSACVSRCSSNISTCVNCNSQNVPVSVKSNSSNVSACVNNRSSSSIVGSASESAATTCESTDRNDSDKGESEGNGNSVGSFSNYGKSGKVQAGWFGKGYRKGRRLKRKAAAAVV